MAMKCENVMLDLFSEILIATVHRILFITTLVMSKLTGDYCVVETLTRGSIVTDGHIPGHAHSGSRRVIYHLSRFFLFH